MCKKGDPLSKITRAKRTGDVTHITECLPHKHEALSSTFSTAKNKQAKPTGKLNIVCLEYSEQ
jgi:hypothetical protein